MNSPYMTTPSSSQGARIVGEGLSDTSGPGPELMTAATLTGNTVVNTADETLGKIEEIMLDVPGGRIAYAVMSSGGFLGLGEKLFAIPWGALTLDTNRECFVLDARAETFENAPSFDKDHWPTQAGDLQWHRDVHAHYGQSVTPLGSVVR